MDLSISITGLDTIANSLAKLPGELQEKYGKRGLKAAAAVTVAAVKNRVPVETGLARESIGQTTIKLYRDSGTLFTAIESRKGFKRLVGNGVIRNPRKYLHIIESGRKAVVAKRGSALHSALDPQSRFFANSSGVLPHPMFEPAAKESESQAVRIIESELNRGIEEWNTQTANSNT